jgi:hemolysin activation/secretion protein
VELRIDVMEGLYGAVTLQSPNAANVRLAAAAQKYATSLQPGSVIESEPLERLSLTLNDLPGIKVTPIMRPGQQMGTGDLDLIIDTTDRLNADVGLDNQGNRYTGQSRVRANLDVNSPFMLGDQITVRSLASELGMRMATLGYSLPVGGSGLRANTSYAHTYYELGGSFTSSQSSGTADVLSAGLSYPLHRSQQVNLTLSGSLQHKKLNDQRGADASSADKNSTTLPLSLNFDRRDGSGVTYGSVSLTSGQLDLDSNLSSADVPAQTAGSFSKVNLDVARVQALNWGHR